MKRAVFLDRDGVLIQKAPEGQYVTSWNDVCFLPGVADAVRLLNRTGFLAIVVTNQRCVAKGLISVRQLDSMHELMCRALADSGGKIDAVYYCPHDIHPACICRKPNPGMLIEASASHLVDLSASWLIGDSETDIQAGTSAGCRTVRILGTGEARSGNATLFANCLLNAVHMILQPEHVN